MVTRIKHIVKYSFSASAGRRHPADHSSWVKHRLKDGFLTIKKLALTIMCHLFSGAHSMISLRLIKDLNLKRVSGFSFTGNS